MVLTGVISEKQAYKAIDMLNDLLTYSAERWPSQKLETTGAGAAIADFVIGLLGKNASPFLLLVAVFMISCADKLHVNTATTALLVPITASRSQPVWARIRAVLMATVIGGSCAYATPIGMPDHGHLTRRV